MIRKSANKLLATLTMTALLGMAMVQNALALPIVGSQSFAGSGVDADPANAGLGNIKTTNLVNFTSFLTTGGTVDYLLGPPELTPINDGAPYVLNIPAAPGPLSSNFVLSEGIFGTFTGSSLTLDDNTPLSGRNIYLLGTFVPSIPAFPAGLQASDASLVLAFTQNGGAGNSISVSATLNTPAVPPPGDGGTVPEPGTVLLLGSGLVGIWLTQRRK